MREPTKVQPVGTRVHLDVIRSGSVLLACAHRTPARVQVVPLPLALRARATQPSALLAAAGTTSAVRVVQLGEAVAQHPNTSHRIRQ